jgi:dimethylhistidine N-methyltransferase
MIARELVVLPSYTDEVVRGLTSPRKVLPCKLLYDDRGSMLFEEITRLPEYYLTRSESEILRAYSREIAQAVGSAVSIVELGAGTATKTGTLLHAFTQRQLRVEYFPADISASALAGAKRRIEEQLASVVTRPMIADFGDGFHFLRNVSGRKLVLYLGSSIGNFDWNDAVGLLSKVREQLSPSDALLLGTDMAKDPDILVPAYDDAQGVTAQFTGNILVRLNRELGARFDPESFRHVAEWNPRASRMEISLESVRTQIVPVRLAGIIVHFRGGERIHVENSYKYTVEMVARLLCVSGFRLEQTWFDSRKWFGLHLASVGKK